MTLKDFIEQYDFAGSYILLEGKRTVAEGDIERLEKLGKMLAKRTRHIIFRSGNAAGADYHFSKAVAEINKDRLQAIIPYTGHRKTKNVAGETFSLDDIQLENEEKIVEVSKLNKKTAKLIDPFVAGVHNRITMKAGYILRDTIKALGTTNIPPATFGIFYDDLDNPKSGGTGHTMHVCQMHNIPIIDQSVWMKWLGKHVIKKE